MKRYNCLVSKIYLKINNKSHDALNECETTLQLYLHCKNIDTLDTSLSNNTTDREIELSDLEKEYFEVITSILDKSNYDSSKLVASKTQAPLYFDIRYCEYSFIRLKTTGKLKYWLSESTTDEIRQYDNNVTIKAGNKSEGKKIRVFLESPQDFTKFTPILLELYDKSKESKESHDDWVARGRPMHYSAIIKFNPDGTSYVERNEW